MKINKSLTTAEIAQIAGGECLGDKTIIINNLNGIAHATQNELTFIASEKYLKHLETCQASAIMIPKGKDIPEKDNCCYIACENPYKSFLQVVVYLDVQQANKTKTSAIAPTAVIGEKTTIAETATIYDKVVIGNHCSVGDGSSIRPGVVIYDNVTIGKNTLIHGNVVIYDNTVIGDNVIIHAGAIIGSDGFGNIENPDGSWTKIPHIGNAIIEDNVEIGSNTTIDRAFVGSTIIHRGAKIDNLVQIAHNCEVGQDTAFAGQVGLAGSTIVGKRNRFAGQVGVAGHIETADDVTILAQSGIAQSVTEKGVYLGAPIAPHLEQIKILMAQKKLPDLLKRVARIERGLNK